MLRWCSCTIRSVKCTSSRCPETRRPPLVRLILSTARLHYIRHNTHVSKVSVAQDGSDRAVVPSLRATRSAPFPMDQRWIRGGQLKYVVGIDIGGTFTDCVAIDSRGRIAIGRRHRLRRTSTRVSSTPSGSWPSASAGRSRSSFPTWRRCWTAARSALTP
jgi:hypothetical protein